MFPFVFLFAHTWIYSIVIDDAHTRSVKVELPESQVKEIISQIEMREKIDNVAVRRERERERKNDLKIIYQERVQSQLFIITLFGIREYFFLFPVLFHFALNLLNDDFMVYLILHTQHTKRNLNMDKKAKKQNCHICSNIPQI